MSVTVGVIGLGAMGSAIAIRLTQAGFDVIGIDLLEIERLERALERHPRLAERVFTEAERDYAAAVAILETADARDKAESSRALAAAWRDGGLTEIGTARPPDRPARQSRPPLVRPGEVPRRRLGRSRESRVALFHALAHIELNAIDLAWDMVARFAGNPDLARGFHDDWVAVAAEEARHFTLLSDHLHRLGASYGDLPAHDGLWQAAAATAHDPLARLARLAVVPLVLEARGLDVLPDMIARVAAAGDRDGAAALEIVYRDEIGHVGTGRRWFDHLCSCRGLPPETTWRALVRTHFKGEVKPPFNAAARRAAGFLPAYYAGFSKQTADST